MALTLNGKTKIVLTGTTIAAAALGVWRIGAWVEGQNESTTRFHQYIAESLIIRQTFIEDRGRIREWERNVDKRLDLIQEQLTEQDKILRRLERRP